MSLSKKQQIVKVQVSLFTSEEKPQVLIYNKDRSVMGEFPLTPDIEEAMGGDHKKFFYALVPLGKKEVQIELLEEAPWQVW